MDFAHTVVYIPNMASPPVAILLAKVGHETRLQYNLCTYTQKDGP